MAEAKEKMVKIVMPVGVDAGKKVSVTESQAASIKAQFGEYRVSHPAAKGSAADGHQAEIASLRSDLDGAQSAINSVTEVLTGDAEPEAKLDAIAKVFDDAGLSK